MNTKTQNGSKFLQKKEEKEKEGTIYLMPQLSSRTGNQNDKR
jgi:hypothetical protein